MRCWASPLREASKVSDHGSQRAAPAAEPAQPQSTGPGAASARQHPAARTPLPTNHLILRKQQHEAAHRKRGHNTKAIAARAGEDISKETGPTNTNRPLHTLKYIANYLLLKP